MHVTRLGMENADKMVAKDPRSIWFAEMKVMNYPFAGFSIIDVPVLLPNAYFYFGSYLMVIIC